jgi:hypothetical protein
MAKQTSIMSQQVGRGHTFGRVGAGRKTSFADRRRQTRSTARVKLRRDINRAG